MYDVCNSGSTDLYIPFFQIAVEMLKDDGVLGYITMNTFLKSLNARELRKFFMDNGFEIKIIDFRGYQIFQGKSTYTCLFFLRKTQTGMLHYYCDEKAELKKQVKFSAIQYSMLDADKGWSLNEYKISITTANTDLASTDTAKFSIVTSTVCLTAVRATSRAKVTILSKLWTVAATCCTRLV